MQRREALQTLAVLAGVPALAGRPLSQLLAVRPPQSALRVLNPEQNATVVALAERIIPVTDTPGATAARVNEFVDVLLADWYTDDERRSFLAGLADVDVRARAAFGAPFNQGTPDQQDGVVGALDDEAFNTHRTARNAAGRFFARFKSLTLYGYYNSEVGATQELHYVMIPNRYEPCMPLEGA